MIVRVSDTDAALPRDRLGLWAQEQGDWAEAERCFRKAHDLYRGDYGFCLGCALNHLDRYTGVLPLLLEQAQSIQPIAMFHLGGSCWNLGDHQKAIEIWSKVCERFPEDEHVGEVKAFLHENVSSNS